jgi:hypothetical protein
MHRDPISNHLLGRFALAALLLTLSGCNAWQNRAEFAAPQSRWPANYPSAVAADAPPPPVQAQYCYRTLASVDCYTEARPDRIGGYTGAYPDPNSIAAAAPYSAPARKPFTLPLLP